jgi:hypothetical protein
MAPTEQITVIPHSYSGRHCADELQNLLMSENCDHSDCFSVFKMVLFMEELPRDMRAKNIIRKSKYVNIKNSNSRVRRIDSTSNSCFLMRR